MFITFEGPDGSGKSTQIRLVADSLRRRGRLVVLAREPGGTELGDELRHLILHPSAPQATPLAVALMLSASRAELIAEVIAPGLRDGAIVLVDRYADSTVAYQCFGSGLPTDEIERLTDVATGGLKPDMTVYVDVSPEEGLRRLRERGTPNRLDAETLDFHRRVQRGYEYLMRREPSRWVRIDGSGTPEQVHAAVVGQIDRKLESVGGAT